MIGPSVQPGPAAHDPVVYIKWRPSFSRVFFVLSGEEHVRVFVSCSPSNLLAFADSCCSSNTASRRFIVSSVSRLMDSCWVSSSTVCFTAVRRLSQVTSMQKHCLSGLSTVGRTVLSVSGKGVVNRSRGLVGRGRAESRKDPINDQFTGRLNLHALTLLGYYFCYALLLTLGASPSPNLTHTNIAAGDEVGLPTNAAVNLLY